MSVDLRESVSLIGIDLDGLFEQAIRIQSQCTDYNVTNATSRNMWVDEHTCKLLYTPDGLSSSEGRSVEMTQHSLSQLCAKLGVPVRYIDKCIDSGRLDLAADNLNSWLEDYGKNLFIREYNNVVRGVLSDRFSVLDTPNILEVLADSIDLDEYKVKGHFLSPERFHARLIQRQQMNIEGEDLFAGIQIDSSDVGRSVLLVQFFIYKQVCTNGLVLPKSGGMLFQQKHIGIDKGHFRDGLKQSLSSIPLLIENATNLIEEARSQEGKYDFKRYTEHQMKDFIERMKMKAHLSEEGVGKVIQLMTNTYGSSTWGLVNSLTEVAQDYTLERRIEIEKVAGDILSVA